MDIRTGHEADGILALAPPPGLAPRRAREGLIARLLPPDEKARRTFAWEADTDGTIRWVDAAAREALIGRNILNSDYWRAPPAPAPLAHITGVRINVPGEGPSAGPWLISGEAWFGATCGRFHGYRGKAWREWREEKYPDGDTDGLAADALRGLVHELRTPLNAIVGFGELIDGQIDGAAATAYRPRTTRIAAKAARLVAAIEELDAAARTAFAERDSRGMMPGTAAAARLPALSLSHPWRKGSGLAWREEPGLPPIAMSAAAFDHLAGRLVALCLGYAEEGERLAGSISPQAGSAPATSLLIALPSALRSRLSGSRPNLAEPAGDWPFAPELGLRFAFHLLSSVATALGAALDVRDARIRLNLPAA